MLTCLKPCQAWPILDIIGGDATTPYMTVSSQRNKWKPRYRLEWIAFWNKVRPVDGTACELNVNGILHWKGVEGERQVHYKAACMSPMQLQCQPCMKAKAIHPTWRSGNINQFIWKKSLNRVSVARVVESYPLRVLPTGLSPLPGW